MDPRPVGLRTRLQRAIQEKNIRERNRRARREARMRYKEQNKVVINVDDDDDDDGNGNEVAKVVDEEEFNKMVAASTSGKDNVAGNVDGFSGPSDLNGDEDSDDSVKIIKVKWNPLNLRDYDDIDDDSDEDDVVSNVGVSIGGGGGGGGGDEGGEKGVFSSELSSSEGDDSWDTDFEVGKEGNMYSSSEISSSSEDYASDEDSSSENERGENGEGGVKECKKKARDGESSDVAKARRKEKRRVCDGGVVGDKHVRVRNKGDKKAKKKKKRERVSKEEMFERFERVFQSVDGGSDVQAGTGVQGGKSEKREYVKLNKDSNGVFRRVACSAEDEGGVSGVKNDKRGNYDQRGPSEKRSYVKSKNDTIDDVGGVKKKKSNWGQSSSSEKLKKSSDGVVFEKEVVTGSSANEDGGSDVFRKRSDSRSGDKMSNDDDEGTKKRAGRRERGEGEEGDEILEREKSEKAMNRRKKKEKAKETRNAMLDTIMEEVGNEVEENMAMDTSKEYFHLPLKFRFPAKEVELEDEESETDKLFKELDFCLQAFHIGSDDSPNKDNTDADQPANGNSVNGLCAGGIHHLMHDEEIGLYCRFCSYVALESKHVTPGFHVDIFGKAGRRDTKKLQSENETGEGLQIPDPSEIDPEPARIVQGTVWELIPGVWKQLYPHQREGFEFIWRNVAGGVRFDELERPSKYGVGGCIICHAPGTGKTRLSIVFIQSYLNQYPLSRPCIVAPRTMLRTWQEEFERWKVDIPFFNLNDDELSGKEGDEAMSRVGYNRGRMAVRIAKLLAWSKGKGVLGLSYSLYEKMANEKSKLQRMRDALLEWPGILVLDEGHTPRNDKSNIWKVLNEVSTKRKVILSGTPFQNNFEELSNTLSLVREEFHVPIKQGACSNYDDRKIEELSNKIRPFVHVHKGEILKETLKGLFASLIVLNPSTLQQRCFAALVGRTTFALDNLVSVASVHPSIFREQRPSFYTDELGVLFERHKDDLDAGVKTRFLFELIRLCPDERVLVFGQYLPPLSFLAVLLKNRFSWEVGKEILYMNGKQEAKERQKTIKLFNDPKSQARVLLASTKACSEGIHLVGASRVVLLDVVWNPSVERQAISRAYRLGQKKDVFVYHLITAGTLEEQKYRSQANKERWSELVFSANGKRVKQTTALKSTGYEDQVLDAMHENEKLKKMFHKVVYQPKADHLIESFGPLNL